jgi:dTMP kinase
VPTAELLLYVADRVQHLETVVRPALAAGKVVVCDRYFDATLVYQGYARGLDKEMIRQLHQLACKGLTPDLTLLLDLDPEAGLARAWRRIHSDMPMRWSPASKRRSCFSSARQGRIPGSGPPGTAAVCHHRRRRRRTGGACAD